MKILLVHNFYRYHGGEDTYVHNQLQLLQSTSHQVKLFSLNSQNIKPHQLFSTTTHLFHNSKLKSQLQPILNSFQPDLIHLHNIYPLITPTIYHLLKQNQIPIIQTLHNYNFFSTSIKPNPYRLLLKLSQIWHLHFKHSYQFIDTFIFPNQFTLNYYRQRFNFITNKNSYFLPNFTFPPKTKPNSPRPYYSFIGRLAPEKGLLPLLQVIKTLPQLQFLIVGQGPLESLVHRTATKLPNLTFQPFLPSNQLSPLFFKSRFLILPSQWLEVMPMSILEALAHSTPIIAPNSPPLQQIIRHKYNALLYSSNQTSQLHQALSIASQLTPSQYHQFQINAFQTFTSNYSPSIHLSSLLSLYHQTISRVGPFIRVRPLISTT